MNNSGIWLVDNSASRHIAIFQYFVNNLEKRDLTLQVEFRDKTKYPMKRVGIESFQSESRYSLHMRDALFVLKLNKKLLYVSTWRIDVT